MRFWQDSSNAEHLFYLLSAFGVAVLLWLFFFEIEKSIAAPGEIAPLGKPFEIASRFEGQIGQIKTSSGQRVTKGAELLIIDAIEDDATLNELESERQGLEASRARLEAQLSRSDKLDLEDGNKFFSSEQALLKTTLSEYTQSLNEIILEKNVKIKQKESLLLELSTQFSRIALTKKRLQLMERLVEKGFEGELGKLEADYEYNDAKSRRLVLERDLEGVLSEIELLDSRLEVAKLTFSKQAEAELSEVNKQLAVKQSRLKSQQERIGGYRLLAPANGIISKVNVGYVGEVIQPRETLLELISEDVPLVFYARITPADISDVRLNQEASVTLENMNLREQRPIAAKVSEISPNSLLDDKTGERYFQITLELVLRESGGNDVFKSVIPGATGQVFIKLGSRKVVQYFLDNLVSFSSGALVE